MASRKEFLHEALGRVVLHVEANASVREVEVVEMVERALEAVSVAGVRVALELRRASGCRVEETLRLVVVRRLSRQRRRHRMGRSHGATARRVRPSVLMEARR